jgi:hypothetical protein
LESRKDLAAAGHRFAEGDAPREGFGGAGRGVGTRDKGGVADETDTSECHPRVREIEDRLEEWFAGCFEETQQAGGGNSTAGIPLWKSRQVRLTLA